LRRAEHCRYREKASTSPQLVGAWCW